MVQSQHEVVWCRASVQTVIEDPVCMYCKKEIGDQARWRPVHTIVQFLQTDRLELDEDEQTLVAPESDSRKEARWFIAAIPWQEEAAR